MKVEIDQSGKIEETNKNTILAFSNGKNDVVVIKSKTKRQLLEMFRRIGQPKLFIYRTFTAGIFLLVEPYLPFLTTISIDTEWLGKDRLISDIFSEFLQKKKVLYKPTITFCFVGKNSPAHILAWSTYKSFSQKKPHKRKIRALSLEKLASLALKSPQKKTEV